MILPLQERQDRLTFQLLPTAMAGLLMANAVPVEFGTMAGTLVIKAERSQQTTKRPSADPQVFIHLISSGAVPLDFRQAFGQREFSNIPYEIVVEPMQSAGTSYTASGGGITITDPRPEPSSGSSLTHDLPATMRDRFRRLLQLPEGWNSYQARRISTEAVAKAADLLRRISQVGGQQMPLPFIAPLASGGLQLEWKLASGKELIIGVPVSGEGVTYLLVEPTPSGGEHETEAGIQQLDELDILIRRFVSER